MQVQEQRPPFLSKQAICSLFPELFKIATLVLPARRGSGNDRTTSKEPANPFEPVRWGEALVDPLKPTEDIFGHRPLCAGMLSMLAQRPADGLPENHAASFIRYRLFGCPKLGNHIHRPRHQIGEALNQFCPAWCTATGIRDQSTGDFQYASVDETPAHLLDFIWREISPARSWRGRERVMPPGKNAQHKSPCGITFASPQSIEGFEPGRQRRKRLRPPQQENTSQAVSRPVHVSRRCIVDSI